MTHDTEDDIAAEQLLRFVEELAPGELMTITHHAEGWLVTVSGQHQHLGRGTTFRDAFEALGMV